MWWKVVSVNGSDEKWLELISGYNIFYYPIHLIATLRITIEFDVDGSRIGQ